MAKFFDYPNWEINKERKKLLAFFQKSIKMVENSFL
jgi:hypothetical protein